MVVVLAAVMSVLLCAAQFLGAASRPSIGDDVGFRSPRPSEEVRLSTGVALDGSPRRNPTLCTTSARVDEARSASTGPTVDFFPNPVRGPVTFMAWNICWCSVDGIRVRLYDQSGRVVFAEASDAPLFETDRVSALPNGVYLGVFELLVEGQWVRVGTGLIAVLN
jgi:hypothetical protein